MYFAKKIAPVARVLNRKSPNITNKEDWISSFQHLLKRGNALKSVPLILHGEVLHVKELTSLLFIFLTVLVTSLDCTYRAWTIYSRPANEVTLRDLIIELANFVGRAGTNLVAWELLLRREQWSMFFNSVVKLDGNLKRNLGGSRFSPDYKALTRFLYIAAILSASFPIFGTLPQQIRDRHQRRFWGSRLLPRSIYDNPVIAVLFLWYELRLNFVGSFAVGLAGSMIYSYMQINKIWLSIVENGKLSSYPLPIRERLELFSSLKILNVLQNETAALFLWPIIEYVLLAGQVCCHVMVFRFLSSVQPSLFLMMEAVIGILMIFQGRCIKSGAEMNAISTQFKNTVTQYGTRFEKKVAKSLHPLRVNVGSFYCYQKSSLTTCFQTHLDTTINVLLGYFTA
ncbi:hypothetical protein Fcan01_26513 [Folsomia candida]|uniref:Gustatory receptor n=1 Tax=Folsomia candida TaxID=158441 RepID=A0A226D215_FOLCA|nr:hypothetical protein Fcan01_26513 [Folsomia candida]